jgi:hypothetical protein
MRVIGSLPAGVVLDATIDRNQLIAEIRQRAQALCSADYRAGPARTEQRLLSHFSGPQASYRQAALTDNNTFLLERLLEAMRKSGSCPYLPPPEMKAAPVPAAVTPPPAAVPSPSIGGKAKGDPVAAVPPPAAARPAEPPPGEKKSAAPSDDAREPAKKSEPPRTRKAQADDEDEDDEPRPRGRGQRSTPSVAPKSPPPSREQRPLKPSPPAQPSQRTPVNVPTF